MIVTVPEYTGKSYMGQKIECQVVVNSGGKLSDPQPIMYKPGKSVIQYLAVTQSYSLSGTLSSCEWFILSSVIFDVIIQYGQILF